MEAFEIIFDDAQSNPNAVYHSGQQIRFQVYLKLKEPVKCRCVYVELAGSSKVQWSESEGSGDNRRTHYYSSSEKYLDEVVSVFTPPTSGNSAGHHPAGEWKYPVAFQLPPTCPSSFEGSTGFIRYSVKAGIDKMWKFDKYTKMHLTVIRPLDLNKLPMAEVGPFATEIVGEVECCRPCWCCSCDCGALCATLRLNKRGFVPGEAIHVSGEIHNTSKTDVSSVTLELYQKVHFHAGGHTRGSAQVALYVELDGIPKGERQQINDLLYVPALPCSKLEGCGNIDLDYYLRLGSDGGCCRSMNEECCQLLIGSVPLRYNMAPQPGAPVTMQPGAPPPRPQYQQDAFGPVQMDQQDAGQSIRTQAAWAPSYPVYPYGQQQQPSPFPPVA